MSIQKKSLISTLKTAKKANFAGKHEGEVKGEKTVSAVKVGSLTQGRGVMSAKQAPLTQGRGVMSAKKSSMTRGRGVMNTKKFNPRVLV